MITGRTKNGVGVPEFGGSNKFKLFYLTATRFPLNHDGLVSQDEFEGMEDQREKIRTGDGNAAELECAPLLVSRDM